jgi:hypothetical protein
MLGRNFDFVALIIILCGMALIQQISRVPDNFRRHLVDVQIMMDQHGLVLPPPPPILTRWHE